MTDSYTQGEMGEPPPGDDPLHWKVGDEVRLPRIGYVGHIINIVPVHDPVVTMRDAGGATLTMSASMLEREHT